MLRALPLLALLLAGCRADREDYDVPRGGVDPTSLRSLHQGKVVGFAEANDTQAWLGLPYAAPPTGALRWRAPRPAAGWTGTREALRYGAPCPQLGNWLSGTAAKQDGEVVGSEDCLTLNVWARRHAPEQVPTGDARRPVMVWIHGGGNSIGTSRIYGAIKNLAGAHDVVVVTLNYRLGVLGWFHHPALHGPEESAEDRSGNYGTLDLLQALRWVREEISAFGGDPGNVTVFGESAGAINLYSLLVAPAARGLFHRAALQSGLTVSWPLSAAESWADASPPGHPNSSRELLSKLLVRERVAKDAKDARARLERMSPEEVARYLRSRSVESLLAPMKGARFGMYPGPFILRDGAVIPDAPLHELLARPEAHAQVPVLLGSNRDEMKLFLSGDERFVSQWLGRIPRIRDEALYDSTSAYLSEAWKAIGVDGPAQALAATQPVFAYRFDWDELAKLPLVDGPKLIGAAHGMEISFVFLDADNRKSVLPAATDENLPGRVQLSEAMASYWAQFALAGAPGKGRAGALPEWKPWPALMLLDSPAGGGPRLTAEPVTLEAVVQRLLADPRFAEPAQRCRALHTVFDVLTPNSGRWSAAEDARAGCSPRQNPWAPEG